jgi:hypothetical protein
MSKLRSTYRPVLEGLEERLVPYVLSGYFWANPNVSASYMPDGTLISSGYPSNLLATYNAGYPTATWQHEFARALQTWADASPLNFHFVADAGSPQGTPGLAQGDSRFGDIRLGGFNFGGGGILGMGSSPYPTTTSGGDVTLNTYGGAFPMGSMPDLYSVLLHESGHALGLEHTTVSPAVMEAGLWAVYPGLYADDIAGIQAIYGTRRPDAYDALAPNDTFASATALSLYYGATTIRADLTTMTDVDYYRVTVPSGGDGTLTVTLNARDFSLLIPRLAVYDAAQHLVAVTSATSYGSVLTISLTGLVAGQTYTILADRGTSDVFGMGAYQLTVQFGGIQAPPPPAPDRFEYNDTPATGTNFGTLTSLNQTGLTLHSSTDVDYYTFVAATRGTYVVSITPTQGSGILGLTVLDAQQTVLANGQSATGGITLSVSLAAGQQVFVRVSSPGGSLFTYNLSIAKSSGGGGGGGHHLVLAGDEATDAPTSPRATGLGDPWQGLGGPWIVGVTVQEGSIREPTSADEARPSPWAPAGAERPPTPIAEGARQSSRRKALGDPRVEADAVLQQLLDLRATDELSVWP